MQSTAGSRVATEPGRFSILAGKQAPATDAYTLTFPTTLERISAVRVEALPDPANPKGGVGRSRDDGNFVLTGITLVAKSPDGRETPILLATAAADFSQKGYPVGDALRNPDPKHHGWAVAPRLTEPHVAVFSTAAPIAIPAGSVLRLTLDQQFEFSYPGFSLGKFRVSVTDDPSPKLTTAIGEETSRTFSDKPPHCRTAAEEQQIWNQFAAVAPQLRAQRDEIVKLKAELAAVKPTATPILRELAAGKRRETRQHNRGNFLDPGDPVDAGIPEAFGTLPAGAPLNRLGVAQWLCARDNPLTARVAVNRVWASLFGIGIVETQEDFGTQGTPPTHPELLDWLAVDFMDQGWSI